MKSTKFVYPDWRDIERSCYVFCAQMIDDGYKPDVIIGLLGGGVIPAKIMADFFDVNIDFFALYAKLYNGIGQTKQEVKVGHFVGDIKGKNVLIVDDIWDSGRTMGAVLDYLGHDKVTTATIYWKENAQSKPDYYSEVAREDEWIIFPWETWEFGREKNKLIKNVKNV